MIKVLTKKIPHRIQIQGMETLVVQQTKMQARMLLVQLQTIIKEILILMQERQAQERPQLLIQIKAKSFQIKKKIN